MKNYLKYLTVVIFSSYTLCAASGTLLTELPINVAANITHNLLDIKSTVRLWSAFCCTGDKDRAIKTNSTRQKAFHSFFESIKSIPAETIWMRRYIDIDDSGLKSIISKFSDVRHLNLSRSVHQTVSLAISQPNSRPYLGSKYPAERRSTPNFESASAICA